MEYMLITLTKYTRQFGIIERIDYDDVDTTVVVVAVAVAVAAVDDESTEGVIANKC
jgi:hypothetical protein